MPDTKIFHRSPIGGLFTVLDESPVTGNVFWCHSGTGTDAAGFGLDPDSPTATIDYAHNLCTASKGDVVYVLPGHTETFSAAAAGVTMDLIGVSIIGLGHGTCRPKITYTATAADWDVDAESCLVRNIEFYGNVNNLVHFLDLDAGNFTLEDCMFSTCNAKEAILFINIATTKDNFHIRRCEFYQMSDVDNTDGNDDTGCIFFEDSENIFIDDCLFYGNFETAILHNANTAAVNVWVRNCRGYAALSGCEIYKQVAGMIGGEIGCQWTVPAEGAATETGFIGTASAKWFSARSGYGNDSGAGGAGTQLLTVCS